MVRILLILWYALQINFFTMSMFYDIKLEINRFGPVESKALLIQTMQTSASNSLFQLN